MRKIKAFTVAMAAALTFFTGTGQAQQSAEQEYVCTLIPCFANKKGPLAESQCRNAVTKYFKDMAKFRPPTLPECETKGNTEMKRGVEVMNDLDGAKVSRPYIDVLQNGVLLNRTYADGMDADFKPYPVAQ
jgi:hypothetical protein